VRKVASASRLQMAAAMRAMKAGAAGNFSPLGKFVPDEVYQTPQVAAAVNSRAGGGGEKRRKTTTVAKAMPAGDDAGKRTKMVSYDLKKYIIAARRVGVDRTNLAASEHNCTL
jgi:hypothetical protein